MQKIIAGIEGVCKIFSNKDWNCDMSSNKLCPTCSDYMNTYYSCATNCNNNCYVDQICIKTNQFYSQIDDEDYKNPAAYNAIKSIADTYKLFCFDASLLDYKISMIWLLGFILFYI